MADTGVRLPRRDSPHLNTTGARTVLYDRKTMTQTTTDLTPHEVAEARVRVTLVGSIVAWALFAFTVAFASWTFVTITFILAAIWTGAHGWAYVRYWKVRLDTPRCPHCGSAFDSEGVPTTVRVWEDTGDYLDGERPTFCGCQVCGETFDEKDKARP